MPLTTAEKITALSVSTPEKPAEPGYKVSVAQASEDDFDYLTDNVLMQFPQHKADKVGKRQISQALEPSEKLDAFIHHVNTDPKLTWKADTCLL